MRERSQRGIGVGDVDPWPGFAGWGGEWGQAGEEVGGWFGELARAGVVFVGVVEGFFGIVVVWWYGCGLGGGGCYVGCGDGGEGEGEVLGRPVGCGVIVGDFLFESCAGFFVACNL